MLKILITGGGGDWAQSFKQSHQDTYDIHTLSRGELDVTSEPSVIAYFERQTTPFDVVINNAGCIHPKRILESDSSAWVNDINVNLIGSFYVSKAALQSNRKTKLIHISSTAAYNAYADWSSYCASKAGVKTLALSLANDGFDSYCLCPGAIDTKFRDKFDIANNNVMSCADLTIHVLDVIKGKYQRGDVLFIRSNEFTLNP